MDAPRSGDQPSTELIRVERAEPLAPASLPERVVASTLGFAWRGAGAVARGLGVDGAIERAFDRGVDRALQSPTVERAAEKVLDSEMLDRVWKRTLESDEAQQLVERVAQAPEVRAAIAFQSVGLVEDIRESMQRGGRRLDAAFERIARKLFRRRRRRGESVNGGIVTRSIAFGVDFLLYEAAVIVISAATAFVLTTVFGGDHGLNSSIQIALAGGLVLVGGFGVYLVLFWLLTSRTPGMSLAGLRIVSTLPGRARLRPRQAVGRLIGLGFAIPFFLFGFVGLVLGDRRRGWPDRFGRTEVLYDDPAPPG